MEFKTESMHFPVHIPDEAMLTNYTEHSPFRTPEKIRRVQGELRFPPAPEERPFLYGCMVLSFDGKMAFQDDPEGHFISKFNQYDPVGGLTDFWMMNVCRTYADGVILGTGSLKARQNKLWYAQISDPELVAVREELGKHTPEPLNLVASINGKDIPFDHPIFSQITPKPLILTSLSGAEWVLAQGFPEARLITSPLDLFADKGDTIRILAAGEQEPDTGALMALLRACGLQYVSVEAPGYIWHLIGEKMLDEFLLNYSGVLAGGPFVLGFDNGYGINHHPHVSLLTIGYHKGFIYTRQRLLYAD